MVLSTTGASDLDVSIEEVWQCHVVTLMGSVGAISMALADPSPSYRANLKRRKMGSWSVGRESV